VRGFQHSLPHTQTNGPPFYIIQTTANVGAQGIRHIAANRLRRRGFWPFGNQGHSLGQGRVTQIFCGLRLQKRATNRIETLRSRAAFVTHRQMRGDNQVKSLRQRACGIADQELI